MHSPYGYIPQHAIKLKHSTYPSVQPPSIIRTSTALERTQHICHINQHPSSILHQLRETYSDTQHSPNTPQRDSSSRPSHSLSELTEYIGKRDGSDILFVVQGPVYGSNTPYEAQSVRRSCTGLIDAAPSCKTAARLDADKRAKFTATEIEKRILKAACLTPVKL